MVYRFAPAVAVVTRIVRPVLGCAYGLGIRLSICVDNGNGAGVSKQEAEEASNLMLEDAWTKCPSSQCPP
jgi:hypothetical protein